MNVYLSRIRPLASQRDRALALLPEERQKKVLSLRQTDDALRSLCAGLLVRRYVGPGPFLIGPHGKPCCPAGPCFSLSHSGEMVVLAVHESPVGIDTEDIRRPWLPAVAQRVFTREEQAWLQERPEAFFYLWTRKEAVLKACGRGFSLSPQSFSVLPDSPCLAEGQPYHLYTENYVNHIISTACPEDAPPFKLIPVDALHLLED